jgi:hypothetical protein
MISTMAVQPAAGYAQQLFIINKIMLVVKSVGIISNKTTDSFRQSATRARLPFGIKVIIAKTNARGKFRTRITRS